jgi:hypothetical protein
MTLRSNVDQFIKLIRRSKKIVCMDAMLQPSMIELIEFLSNTTGIIFNHVSYPKTDYTCNIVRYSNTSNSDKNTVISSFKHLAVNQRKRVIGMICSRQLLNEVYDMLTKNGVTAIKYTGDDAALIEGQSMNKVKALHLKDVNTHFAQYQCVLYTASISAGISFEADHFDTSVNVFIDSADSCDIATFVQGIHRCRQLRDRHVTCFIESKHHSQLITPYD